MARVPTHEIPQGDTRNATVDFTASSSDFGVNVSSAVWSIEEGTSISLAGSVVTGSNLTTESLVAASNKIGCTLVKVKATMSDGQTISKYFRVNVIDPTC